ncbi:unnamed protein product [Caenorhabditis sp. 36 PRJEB53466]|nr:unnamed protein product [Caenorhabditis sp. 36 PRJEB53466]
MLYSNFPPIFSRFALKANVHQVGETHWQLFNECSQGMLQSFIGSLNTRGYPDRHCLTDWNVVPISLETRFIFRIQRAWQVPKPSFLPLKTPLL